jgi:DNA-binding beta-propeller fold protein YncE
MAALPPTGLVLLDLKSGAQIATLSVGMDPVAVTVSPDGAFAYLADSSPGDVYAVNLAQRSVKWRAHVGGAPFGLLLAAGHLYVSLFTVAMVDELDIGTGMVLASHPVGQGPAAMALDVEGHPLVAERSGFVASVDGGGVIPAGHGYGIATLDADTWTCGYAEATIVRAGDGNTFQVPQGLHPFWLSEGAAGTILIAAEGNDEDADPGGVFMLDPGTGAFTTLARPRDPDQVIESGATVFVAAHGDKEVLKIAGESTSTWAPGAAAVGLAADLQLNLLVVAVNAHE